MYTYGRPTARGTGSSVLITGPIFTSHVNDNFITFYGSTPDPILCRGCNACPCRAYTQSIPHLWNPWLRICLQLSKGRTRRWNKLTYVACLWLVCHLQNYCLPAIVKISVSPATGKQGNCRRHCGLQQSFALAHNINAWCTVELASRPVVPFRCSTQSDTN